MDILRRSAMGSDDHGSVVSPSVATAHEEPKPEGANLVVGYPRDNQEDTVQELQKFRRLACPAQEGGRPTVPIGGPAKRHSGVHQAEQPRQPDAEGGQVPGLHLGGRLQDRRLQICM